MGVDTLHPAYEARQDDWLMIRDALEGQRVVKGRRQLYLPPPPGMATSSKELLASTGKRTTTDAYDFYLSFAEFPEIVEPALTGFQGIIHARTPRINIPSRMEYLEEDATPEGFSLQVLWQTVTREVLSGGRVGLLADVSQDDQIRIVPYSVENVINWQERSPRLGGGAFFVVIRELKQVPVEDEDGNVDEFKTEMTRFYRELRVREGLYQTRLWRDPEGTRFERQSAQGSIAGPALAASGDSGDPVVVEVDGQEWTTISLLGRTFDTIPFVSINALDIGLEYGAIPILPMTRRAFSIFRLTADYRRSLYMKGDPQPYVAGIPEDKAPPRIGGEELWTFDNPEAKPGYLDIDGDGIPLMRQAIQDELERFDQEGGKLLSTTQRPESGEALAMRLLAHQVTLRNVVINAGRGLEMCLKTIAEMFGLETDNVSFEPDLDFASPIMTGVDAGEWAKAQRLGFPISSETLHGLARRGGVTEKTYEEELEAIENDAALLGGLPKVPDEGGGEGGGGGGEPTDNEDRETSEPETNEDGDGESGGQRAA